MDEALINAIVERTGMTRDQAAEAARVTADFLKERVPSNVAGEIDGIMAGESVKETISRVGGTVKGVFR